jgi:5-methylcytosine-specific restriction endonuclease McrA
MDTIIPQDTTPLKQCTGPCQQWLPATTDFFHRHIQNGLHPRCKKCRSTQRREARETRPEVRAKERTNSRKWQENNPERAKSQKKAYHDAHKDEAKAYHQAHREKRIEYNKEWHRTNREHTKEYRDAYYQEHVEEMRAYSIAYSKANPIPNRQNARNRRMLKKQIAVKGSYTPTQIQEQLKRQKYKCYYGFCGYAKFMKQPNGMSLFHIEHVVPLSRGGSNDISNIVLACPTCNLKKHDKLPHEFPEGGRLL